MMEKINEGKLIPLTQGLYAIVDEDDYELLSQYHWYAMRDHQAIYAVRNAQRPDGS
jgi:hypothetical protein